jgi:protein-S-isoprenylcysteine O-methyltransferase Ste14
MPIVHAYAIALLWLGWLAYWVIAAGNVKATASEESWQSRVAYSAPLWLAAFLLIDRHLGPLSQRFLSADVWIPTLGVLLTAIGFAFTIWARVHLGTNWSAEVTVKHSHELVRTGPYALARHPIYTGLTLAFVGTAVAVGEWRGLLAAAIAVASFCYKLSIEERVMLATFGNEYRDYRRKVRALIPFVI